MWGKSREKWRSLARQRLPSLCLPAVLGASTGSWLREHIPVTWGAAGVFEGKLHLESWKCIPGDLCRPGGHGGCTGERGRAWCDAAHGPRWAKECDSENGSGRSADTEKIREGGLPQQRKCALMHAGDFFHINIVFFFNVLPTPCYILVVALCVDNSEWCFLIQSTAFKINCIEIKALS